MDEWMDSGWKEEMEGACVVLIKYYGLMSIE